MWLFLLLDPPLLQGIGPGLVYLTVLAERASQLR